MLNYRTVLLAQTGICSGILQMAGVQNQSLALSTSASRTSSPRLLYVHTSTRRHGLQATFALVSRSGTLTQKLIRNPATPIDEPSNRQSVNTGLRLYRTTRLWCSSDVAGLANHYILQREAQPRAAQWHEPTRRAKLLLCSLQGKYHWNMHESTSCLRRLWSFSPQPMRVRPLNRSKFTRPQGQMEYQDMYCEHALTNWQVSSLTFSTSPCPSL